MNDSQRSLKRSTTLPTRPASRARNRLVPCESTNEPSVLSDEVLYYHPSAKIVKFELPQSSFTNPILPDLDYPVDAIETLQWRVSTERIASLGALKIEKIAGSTAFLKAGSVVYALLKNCQCWCVDGQSIFVLRIRKLTYYRIELSYETEEDIARVENLKIALSKIIRYEITPCPFKRGFSVEIPEEAKTPTKKKAWRPKKRSVSECSPLRFGPDPRDTDGRESSGQGSIDDDASGDISDRSDNITDVSQGTSEEPWSSPIPISTRSKGRRVSEPAQTFQSLVAKFQTAEESEEAELAESPEESSRMSSFDSYHSCNDFIAPDLSSPVAQYPQSSTPSKSSHELQEVDILPQHSQDIPQTPVMPEPRCIPDTENQRADICDRPLPTISSLSQSMRLQQVDILPQHRRDTSQTVSTPEPVSSLDTSNQLPVIGGSLSPTHSISSTSTNEPSSDEGYSSKSTAIEDPNSRVRKRLRNSRKREFSPLPSSSILFTPSPKTPVNHLTESLLQKTFTYVLGPPAQFLVLLLRLAAVVAAQGGNHAEADSGQSADQSDSLSEDDFGVPLASSRTSSKPNRLTDEEFYDSIDEMD